ncbi:MAG: oligoribonuclease [Proteobacteria bacterium]|nr:MAG: oligoribonuclease [Pseudomonadota bacterium]PIE40409.1 MAG: oligoribonuclease [Gammaproteobacteria bacterium]
MSNNSNLVWIDLEMTGLNPDINRIIEIATIVTDGDLNVLAEGPNLVIHQPDDILGHMDEWCTTTHGQSGLTERVRKSTISVQEAERQTLDFLEQYVQPGLSPLCGNSIGQDRRFMVRYMPLLEAFVNYRNVDVSTVKELAVRWKPEILAGFQKKGSHLALEDIRESIAELQFYRQHFFDVG